MNVTVQSRTVVTEALGIHPNARPNNARRRPLLNLAITLLTRASGDLQLGWDPDRAVLIRPPAGVSVAHLAALLNQADGARSCADIADAADAIGVSPHELGVLLDELAHRGLLSWAPQPPLVGACSVHLHGRGPLADALCDALALSGTRPTRSIGRLAVQHGWPALVVLADDLVTDPCLVSDLVAARISHLSVRMRDGIGMVGPLVLPGRTSCLRCADLHRSDHDPEWPLLAAQLLGKVGHGSPAAVRVTTGIALGQIEHLLGAHAVGHGPPRALDATIEVDPHRAELRRRVWSPHPRCGCGASR
jgi:bacteriocin biosynthesis cyclodehydratase domain-containing protein